MFDIPHAFSIDAIIASDSKTVMKEATKEVKMFANHLKRVLPDRTVVPACYACFFKQTTLLLARSRLLTLVSVADHVHHLLSVTDLAIDHNPRDPLVVLGSLVSSLEVEQRTLSALRALQNDVGIDESHLTTVLHTLLREVNRALLANEEVPPLLREVLLSAQLHVVAVTLLLAVLALEGGRIASQNLGVAVGNDVDVGNGHHIVELTELNKILGDKHLAIRAVGFDVKGDLHIIGLDITLPKENPTAIARAAIVKVTAKILESIRRLFCHESQVGYFKNPIGC